MSNNLTDPPGIITGVLIGTFFIFSGVELSALRVAQMKSLGTYTSYLHSEIMRVVPTGRDSAYKLLYVHHVSHHLRSWS
jgi:hypothetical protein